MLFQHHRRDSTVLAGTTPVAVGRGSRTQKSHLAGDVFVNLPGLIWFHTTTAYYARLYCRFSAHQRRPLILSLFFFFVSRRKSSREKQQGFSVVGWHVAALAVRNCKRVMSGDVIAIALRVAPKRPKRGLQYQFNKFGSILAKVVLSPRDEW